MENFISAIIFKVIADPAGDHVEDQRLFIKCRKVVMSVKRLDQATMALEFCTRALSRMTTPGNKVHLEGVIHYCRGTVAQLHDEGGVGEVTKLSRMESLALGLKKGNIPVSEAASKIFNQIK